MKHKFISLLSVAVASLSAISCGNKTEANLSGSFSLGNDTLIIKSANMDRSYISRDTIVMNNGNFQINMPDTVPLIINIIPEAHNDIEKKTSYPTRLLMLPGDKIILSGDIKEPTIKGSELYDALNGTEFYELYKENELLHREIARVFKTLNDENRNVLDSLLDASQEMDRRLNEAGMKLVKEQPENIASAFATLKMFDKESLEATEMLGADVKEGKMKKVIENNKASREKSLNKQKEWDNIKTGMQAPDFKLNDINGEEKTLSSFKDKYVVLEFWGTWCPWCIKGLPMMRNYYERYKSQVEFVSINCRDTDEAWRKCIEKYDLTWTQLFNGKNKEVLEAYGVLGFPSKIIIDKEGRIVEKYLDEEKTFYQKLDELFGK